MSPEQLMQQECNERYEQSLHDLATAALHNDVPERYLISWLHDAIYNFYNAREGGE